MGYESVALIPLRNGNEVFGLLQFNDRRPNRFNPDLIAHIESIAGNLALALSQRQAVKALQVSEERFRAVSSNIPGAIYQFIRGKDGAFEIPFMSEGAVSLLERPQSELQDASLLFENVHPDDVDGMWSSIAESASSLTQWEREFRIVGKKRTIKWLRGVSSPSALSDGSICWNGVLLDITERKCMEDALRESHQRLEFALQGGELGTWDWNPQDGTVVYSDLWAQMLGYRPDEVEPTVEFFKQHVHPEDLTAVLDRLTGHVEGRLPAFESEHRLRTKSGRFLWVMDRGKIVERGKDGSPVRVTGIIADITKRKLVEEALLESEELLDATGFMARVGGWQLDVETMAVTWTKETSRIHEVPLNYKPPLDKAIEFYHPDDRDALSQAIQRALDRGEPYDMELRFITAKGNNLWTRTVCRPKVIDGKSVRLRGTFQDITERKQAEKALQESEEKYRKLVNTAPYGIQLTDLNGKIIFSNPAHHMIQGYEDGELTGKFIWDLISDNFHREKAKSFYQELVKEQPMPKVYFNRDRTKDGREIDVQINWDYIYNLNGEIEGIISIISDITDQKKLQTQLHQAQKMEAIGSLAGGIAHDLNNILFPISGLSEMLLDEMTPDSPEHQSIEQIYKSAQRGSDLVKQILAFSRQSNPQKLPLRLQPILKEVLKLVRATISMNIEIKSHFKPDCGLVFADPTQVHQIAMNLITNAYHAVEQTGGTIDLELKETEFGKDDTLKPGKYAHITVSDTGIGIEQTLIDKIFDPYFTTKEMGKGTGLGLSVVHGIVKEHGGDILVYSEVGKGTTFHVYLPLLEDSKGSRTAAVTRKYPTGCESILLVDDEEPIIRLEQMMLERLGYKVTTRTSSPDALDAFRADPLKFDLVISDRGMPNMTGEQLARELISIRPEMPIILCTGFSDENDERRARDLGVKGFLKKPVATGDLAEMVRKVLDAAKDSTHT
jgi:PAS domain S-box-containing protein